MNYYHRRNINYVLWFGVLALSSYFALKFALVNGFEQRVVEVSAIAIAYSAVSLVANATKIFD